MTAYFTYLIFSIIILQLLDIISSLYAFKQGAIEANPIMKKSIDLFGNTFGLLLPKLPFVGLLWYFQKSLPVESLVIVIAIYLLVIINNFKLANKLKKQQATEHAESVS